MKKIIIKIMKWGRDAKQDVIKCVGRKWETSFSLDYYIELGGFEYRKWIPEE